jgi:alanine racemase
MIDTGMRRQGILPEEISEAEAIIKENEALRLEGIATHFCDADNPDESFTEGQIDLWNRIVKQFRASFPHMRYVHAAATDGLRFSSDIEANVGRLGIGLYGLSDNAALGARLKLLPILSITTILTGVKRLKSGETIGYGNTYKAVGDMTVSTIPVGYFEGLDRRMSSNGFVQVGSDKIPCEIVGRVSMNISSIDVSKVEHPIVGTPVTVVSDKADDSNSIQTIAKQCGTIPYEIAVKIPAHLKRAVVD